MKDDSNVPIHCKSKINLNATLPQATHLTTGKWAISSTETLKFSIVCPELEPYNVEVSPPLSIITLKERCTASNQFLLLPAFFESKSQLQLHSPLDQLELNWKTDNFTILYPFKKAFPSFESVKIPAPLRDMKEISLSHLVDSIQNMNNVVEQQATPNCVYIIIVHIHDYSFCGRNHRCAYC